jgi:hypothetical protein
MIGSGVAPRDRNTYGRTVEALKSGTIEGMKGGI